MSFPMLASPGVYIGAGASGGSWFWTWGAAGWPGNTVIMAQPLGPLGSLPKSPGLVTTPGPVYMNNNGTYTFWVSVVNSTANQSCYFNLQVSSN